MTDLGKRNDTPFPLREILDAAPPIRRGGAIITVLISFIIYFLTTDREASFWDCPEYITCATMLEVGHPPGNPAWMLAVHTLLLPFPAEWHPFIVNLSSALFSALAAGLLMMLIYIPCAYLMKRNGKAPAIVALSAALAYALCDSAWFSAVEAEVYAMSTFLSLLSLWLTVLWMAEENPASQSRLLILIAYIMGLSLGVHQLNLLIIPVIALAICYHRNPSRVSFLKGLGALAIGCVGVALILFGMMNGTLRLAGNIELLAVNTLGLSPFTGVLIYTGLLILAFSLLPILLQHIKIIWAPLLLFPLFLLSGIFFFGEHGGLSNILSAIAAIALCYIPALSRRDIVTGVWSLGFIILGYSSFALLLIRGYAAPPMNEGTPTDIFALTSYIAREQYGSKPLFYGATPYSRPMVYEDMPPEGGTPKYSRYVLEKVSPKYTLSQPGARLYPRSGFITEKDSARNGKFTNKNKPGYLLADYTFKRVMTPELDMWLPRITSSDPSHIESYADWAGMVKEEMTECEVSYAIDSLGRPVGKLRDDGSRETSTSYRPTYLQNLRYFLTYQTGYMYLRYLGWNFIGRQNDIPSTGEIEHGNIVAGIPPIDRLMVGDMEAAPSGAWSENAGRTRYFAIPFILGIIGIITLSLSGKGGKRIMTLTLLLFLMTGPAIVVYLNQTPGEPRERDYSFLVSYAVFAIWIGCGMARAIKVSPLCYILTLLPVFMGIQNYRVHDRTGRGEPLKLAKDILQHPSPSVIFTQGDNYTFPLWYAQEVKGIGKEHVVIDLSYLSLPGYVVNLIRQGNLPLTATSADIAYGAYSFTRVPEVADTVSVPLITALRELYACREGEPRFRHSRVYIPGPGANDTTFLNLKDFTTGGNLIPFRRLMILDILASSMESDRPKPLLFLNRLRRDVYRPLVPAMRRDIFAYAYDPLRDSLHFDILPSISPSSPSTPDPLVAEMVTQRRGEILAAAKRKASSDPTEALRILKSVYTAYPLSHYPPGMASIGDSLFNEGLEGARLLKRVAGATGDTSLLLLRDSILHEMRSEAKAWKRYHALLPPSRRGAVATRTLRKIALLPAIEREISDTTLNTD